MIVSLLLKFPEKEKPKEQVRGSATSVCGQGPLYPVGTDNAISLSVPLPSLGLKLFVELKKNLSVCFIHVIIVVSRDTSRFRFLWASLVKGVIIALSSLR